MLHVGLDLVDRFRLEIQCRLYHFILIKLLFYRSSNSKETSLESSLSIPTVCRYVWLVGSVAVGANIEAQTLRFKNQESRIKNDKITQASDTDTQIQILSRGRVRLSSSRRGGGHSWQCRVSGPWGGSPPTSSTPLHLDQSSVLSCQG